MEADPSHLVSIIFNGSGDFAVFASQDGCHLPSGEIGPNQVIANECITSIGLSRSNFSPNRPFQLIHIFGRGVQGFTFYFGGELTGDDEDARQFAKKANFLSPSALATFAPREVVEKLL